MGLLRRASLQASTEFTSRSAATRLVPAAGFAERLEEAA